MCVYIYIYIYVHDTYISIPLPEQVLQTFSHTILFCQFALQSVRLRDGMPWDSNKWSRECLGRHRKGAPGIGNA